MVFPDGLCYDKKKQAFRTERVNEAILAIASLSGDFGKKTRGLRILKNSKSPFAERTLPISNLKPLNELETSRLEKAISPHKIHSLKDEALADLFLRDLTAINEFLYYAEAEPFVTPEKPEIRKRVAFKKVDAA